MRGTRFGHGSEYVVRAIVPGGGERVLIFGRGSAHSRDRMLDGMIEYFDEDGADEIPAKLVKVGRTWLIKRA
jgi:hypothetical protein